LAAYQDARRVLAGELGVDPGPELQLLQQQILAADPGSPPPGEHEQAGPALQPGPGGGTTARGPVVPRQPPMGGRPFPGPAGELAVLAELAAEAGGADGANRAVVISAIEGTAGIGKTALAVHFAHQVAGDFPDGQLYVNLRGFDPAGPPMPADEAIRILLDAL